MQHLSRHYERQDVVRAADLRSEERKEERDGETSGMTAPTPQISSSSP